MTSCTIWTGRLNGTGYGVVLINGKQFFAHRLAVALSGRNIPKTKVCDHLCRNRACINPDHIELVSITENVMRGMALPAQHARRTSCLKGHPYTPENTRRFKDKKGRVARHCKRCYADREYSRAHRLNPLLKTNKRKYE